MSLKECLVAGKQLTYLSYNFSDGEVTAAFSSRLGGTSEGAYSFLNLGLHVGDDSRRVIANRLLYGEALGVDLSKMVTAQQVHGTTVQYVSLREEGRGALDIDTSLPETDALVTDYPGLCLGAFFADCVPLYFYDSRNRAVGLAHAGWRGTLGHIGVLTLRKMRELFGTQPRDCSAVIGPSIGYCCYQVSESLAEKFEALFPGGQVVNRKRGQVTVDLRMANALDLFAAGMEREHVFISKLCTACRQDLFFSYRADGGTTGRMAAVIRINEKGTGA